MLIDVCENGVGMIYLCDYSVGFGKISIIFWMVYDLVKLCEDNGDLVFNSVIIVIDCNVLDGQFQDVVKQIDYQFGVIVVIDWQKLFKFKSK